MSLKKNALMVITLTLGLSVASTGSALASNVQPGSAADPLVAQSYVDEKYSELFDMVMDIINGGVYTSANQGVVMTESEKTMLIEEILVRADAQMVTGGQMYTPVFAYRGQVVLGGEGTEIILRSGTATAYIQGENGISDITSGWDLLNGAEIHANHLLIVPRNDGRGVRVTTDAWFLIKGTYTVVY